MSAKTYDKKTAAFAGFVIQNMPENLTDEIMQGWMDNPPAMKKYLAGLVPPEAAQSDRIAVDYGQTLEVMIAAGHYDWTNSDITPARFPIKGKGVIEYEYKLVHLGEDIDSDSAKDRVEKDGWKVGGIGHLLAFGAKYPEEQRKYPIMALGSVAEVSGNRYVAYLDRLDAKRRLHLSWWCNRWPRFCRFLVVRKVSAS